MAFNLHSFCPEAWSQIEIDAEGDFKICCLANFDDDFGMARDDNDEVMNILTHSIQDALNSKTHREHRQEMMINERPDRCRNCWDSEAVGGGSKRQRVLQNTAKSIPEYITVDTAASVTDSEGYVTSKVVNLDLRFGNLCNQKCVMCSPQHSNQWYDDFIALDFDRSGMTTYKKGRFKEYGFVRDEHGKTKFNEMARWWETERWWSQFEEIAPRLRYIYFTGGEPLLVPAQLECLDRLVERGFAKDIQLRYDTNLSVINPKIIDRWKNFKKVFLCVSMDETYERYNLIRNPGNYDKFLNNLIEISKNKIEIHYLSSCIGIATPYAMIRTLPVADVFGVRANYRFLEGPKWLDIRHYPKAAKVEIISKLQQAHDKAPLHHQRWYMGEISLLRKYMNQEDRSHLREFIRVMDILDKQRKTDWKNTIPDVYDLLMNYSDLDKD
jgi:MoaA/NifB/PqqE/SkfB family radical SAM enzyme